jgi:8-oxo-dGTP pyrophosphatase MutT (NUDIX family)
LLNLDLIKKLPKVLNKKIDLHKADAAVSLLLAPIVEDYEILFVKRVERSTDPWSGQIAFPGGKIETSDNSLKDTVIREVFEETNILVKEENILGALEIIKSESKRNIKILPFIVILEEKPFIKLNKNELDKFFWIPYKNIENSRGITNFGSREIPAYIFGKDIVWGVTYNILAVFNKIIESLKNS